MARPTKKGIDYFPFDVDFLQDESIRILKVRFGADGLMIYIYLLCRIYREGYYIRWSEDTEYIVADELSMSHEKVKQVLKFLLKRSLLDDTLFQSDTIITSTGIQKRYQEAVKARASKRPIKIEKYWLLDEDETAAWLQVSHFANCSENNNSNSENNDSNSEEKHHKVKESKVKERRGEESNSLPPFDGIMGEAKPSIYDSIVSYLNKKVGTSYQSMHCTTRSKIDDRLNDGFTLDDFKKVIDKKVAEWQGTELRMHLRPDVLFGDNFEIYLNQPLVTADEARKEKAIKNGNAKSDNVGNFEQRQYEGDYLDNMGAGLDALDRMLEHNRQAKEG